MTSTTTPTYSVIARNRNSWTQDEDGGNREYEITAHCGHNHKTREAAQSCMDKLTAWHCNCGERSDSHRRCSSSTGHTQDSTSARWYHAQVGENA